MTDTLRHKRRDVPSSYVGNGVSTEPGDEVEPDDSEQQKALLDTGYFERVEESDADEPDGAPFDPGGYTVDELREKMTDEEYSDDELEALRDAELEGQNRDGAIDVLGPTAG